MIDKSGPKAFDIVVVEEGDYEGIVKYRRAVYDKAEVDAAIAELKQKLHDAEMQADLAECAVTEYKIDYDKHERELDKWYAKLCRNRWRRAYAMFQHCSAMNRLECDTSPYTMNMHQFWRYHTGYWSRWMKRWLKVCLEYKERIE